jgi:hypothetical protein
VHGSVNRRAGVAGKRKAIAIRHLAVRDASKER